MEGNHIVLDLLCMDTQSAEPTTLMWGSVSCLQAAGLSLVFITQGSLCPLAKGQTMSSIRVQIRRSHLNLCNGPLQVINAITFSTVQVK